MSEDVATGRKKMSFETKLGEKYLDLRRKSLHAGTSKSIALPYALKYIDEFLVKRQKQTVHVTEFGCCDGIILNELYNLVQSSKNLKLSGFDYNESLLKSGQVNFPNINFHLRDIYMDSLSDFEGKFDIVLMINTLHEIFSFYGTNEKGKFNQSKGKRVAEETLRKVVKTMQIGGCFVLFDGVESFTNLQKKVSVRLQSDKVEKNLLKFIREYKPYKFILERTGELEYKMSLKAFTRFITKYRFIDSLTWYMEKEESYQYFHKEEFEKEFINLGLQIEAVSMIAPNIGKWAQHVDILDNDIPYPYEHILIVGRKIKNI